MTEKNTQAEDEVTLPPFKIIIFQFFGFVFEVFAYLRLVVRKSKVLLLAGAIAGMMFAYLFYKMRPPRFEANMTVQSRTLTKQTFAEILEQLSGLTNRNNPAALASTLSVSTDLAKEIVYIEGRSMDGMLLEKDTSTKLNQPIQIGIGLYRDTPPDSMQNALVNYLNNIPYVNNKLQALKKMQLQRVEFIDNELARLDSLKNSYYHLLQNPAFRNASSIYGTLPDPSDLFVHSSVLNNEKLEAQRWLSTETESVSVINGLKTVARPRSFGLVIMVILGFFFGLFVAFIAGFLTQLDRRIKTWQVDQVKIK